jgi:hypothetical protein
MAKSPARLVAQAVQSTAGADAASIGTWFDKVVEVDAPALDGCPAAE